MKRGMLGWAIAEIRDPKSEAFIRKEMLEPIARSEGRLARFALGYYEAIAKYCGGDDDAKDAIDTGIRGALEWAGGTEKFRDEARKERDISQFEPKADWEVAGRSWGGGRGDGGRGGGGRKRWRAVNPRDRTPFPPACPGCTAPPSEIESHPAPGCARASSQALPRS